MHAPDEMPATLTGAEIEVLDERDEIGDVVVHGAGVGRIERALAVPSQVDVTTRNDSPRPGTTASHVVWSTHEPCTSRSGSPRPVSS